MKNAIDKMKNSLLDILGDNLLAIYLFGSVTLDDFKLGWSDIDILCFTNCEITQKQADLLVNLRQALLKSDKNNLYYRSFEGAIVSFDEFLNKQYKRVIYWGTSGEKITDKYYFDCFSQYELIQNGILIYGEDIRANLKMPTYNMLKSEVINHYNTIRKYAVKTDKSLYSCGWFLDIARGIYTLRTGEIIAKTKAGEWALDNNICPDKDVMIKTLKVRNNPLQYKNTDKYISWACSLGDEVQKFADVLQAEIENVN